MPDADKLYRKASPYYRNLLNQIDEWALDPEEIAWAGHGAIIQDVRRRGAEAIQLLIEATDYLAELPSEPLFRLAFTEVEISEALERILYSGMEDLRDKRTVAVIEQVFEDLTHQHSKAVDYPIDSSSAIRMYLERIWETEVSAVATNMFGNESIQRLELLEPLVLEGIGNIANQIERRPSLKHIRRPRRKNRPQIDINTDLLGVQSPSYEQA